MWIAFHKPYGVLCQFTPELAGQRTLADFGFPKHVYPLGRLDMDSEGLLLLCDEAGVNHRLLDPTAAHPRSYWAQVEGVPQLADVAKLARGGIQIRGDLTRPCESEILLEPPVLSEREPPVRFRKAIPTSWLRLSLVEGKNRQVRRMTAAVGLPTLRLIRHSIGALQLGTLPCGQWKELTPAEIQSAWAH